MRLIDNLYRWLGIDGLLHVLCSIIIVMVAGIFLPVWASASGAIVIGAAKELVWDKWLRKGFATWHDFVCDIIGVAAGVAFMMLDLLIN